MISREPIAARMAANPEFFASSDRAFAMLENGEPLFDALKAKQHAEAWTEPEGSWFELEPTYGQNATLGQLEEGMQGVQSHQEYRGANHIGVVNMLEVRIYDKKLAASEQAMLESVPITIRHDYGMQAAFCMDKVTLLGAGRFGTNGRYVMFRGINGQLKLGPNVEATKLALRKAGFTEEQSAYDGSFAPVPSESQIPVTVEHNYQPGLKPLVYSTDPKWTETSSYWRKAEEARAAEERTRQAQDTAMAVTALAVNANGLAPTQLLGVEQTTVLPTGQHGGESTQLMPATEQPEDLPEPSENFARVIATLPQDLAIALHALVSNKLPETALSEKTLAHMKAMVGYSLNGGRTMQMPKTYTNADLRQLNTLIAAAKNSQDLGLQGLAAHVHQQITDTQN